MRVVRLLAAAALLGVALSGVGVAASAVVGPQASPATDTAAELDGRPASEAGGVWRVVGGVLGDVRPAPAGAQEVPAGCPGGPPGPPEPGTRCPDGTVPGTPPAGCPGGPAGRPVPGTECPDGSVPVEPLAPAGCPFGPQQAPEVGTQCPDGSTPRDPNADRALRNIFGVEDGDTHSLRAYDIGCDEGSWNAFLRKMWCGAQSLPFSLGKWFIGIGTDVLAWALEFRVADVLTPVAGLLSRVYNASLVGPLNITMLAWTLALFVGGWHLMRSRWADGFREIFATFLIAILGGMLLANPQGYLEGSVALAQNSSGAVLEAVDGAISSQPAQDADAVRRRLGGVLRRSFVAEPYDLINWGEPLSGQCATARDQILEGGPWGSEDRPREIMREAGCERAAEFNADPSDERAAAALTVSIASILITVLMMLMALAVFAAQVTLVALFSVASLIWALALFPGNRGVMWWWISRLLWSVLVTFASMFLLSWTSITVTALLDATSDLSIVQRCLIVIVIVGVAYRFRSAVDRGVDAAAAGLARSMSGVTSSGGGGGAGAFAAGAAAGAIAGPLSVRPRQLSSATLAAGTGAAAGARRGVNVANTTRAIGAQAAQRTRAAGATTAAVVAAPLAIGRGRARATPRSTQVRNRLDQARESARHARHPIATARATRKAAERTKHETYDWM
jgi:hypothetical protein